MDSSSRNSDVDVTHVVEEPWSDDNEQRLRTYFREACNAQQNHKRAGYLLKTQYRVFTFLIIAWASVIFITEGVLSCNVSVIFVNQQDENVCKVTRKDKIVKLCIAGFGIFLNSLFASLNIGHAYREHFEYETKFYELAQDIEFMLGRGRPYRVPADVFLTEIKERMKKLKTAPEFPFYMHKN